MPYAPTGRENDTSLPWYAQHDPLVQLTELKRLAFATLRNIFVDPNNGLFVIDDYFMGARVNDTPTKTLSPRKAEHEEHTIDIIADTLYHCVVQRLESLS